MSAPEPINQFDIWGCPLCGRESEGGKQTKTCERIRDNAGRYEAAAELLRALKNTVAALDHWFPRWGDPLGAQSGMMNDARAAIAKAEAEGVSL